MSGEVEGRGRRADDEGQWRTADGEKFLLLLSNTPSSEGCQYPIFVKYDFLNQRPVFIVIYIFVWSNTIILDGHYTEKYYMITNAALKNDQIKCVKLLPFEITTQFFLLLYF